MEELKPHFERIARLQLKHQTLQTRSARSPRKPLPDDATEGVAIVRDDSRLAAVTPLRIEPVATDWFELVIRLALEIVDAPDTADTDEIAEVKR